MSDDDADRAATWLFLIVIYAIFGIFILIFKLFQNYPKPMSILLGVVVLFSLLSGLVGWIAQGQRGGPQPYYYSTPVPNYPTPTSSGELSASKGWQIRLYNMDEHGEAYLNGTLVASVDYRPGETGWIDISDKVGAGDNTLRLVTQNVSGGYAWGFDVAYEGSIVWSS